MADALDDEWLLEEKDVENTGKLSHWKSLYCIIYASYLLTRSY